MIFFFFFLKKTKKNPLFSDLILFKKRDAQNKQLRIWKTISLDAKPDEDKGKSAELLGIVIEVNNAGAITICEQPSGRETKVYLSSIKVPRGGNLFKKDSEEAKAEGEGENKDSPQNKAKKSKEAREKELKENKEKKKEEKNRYWAFEGKEFLRKRLIGQRVRCIFDYKRAGFDKVEKPYFSVYIDKK